MMATLRSSARSTPRKKYTVDAFEGVAELQSDISSESEQEARSPAEDDEDAADFQTGREPSEADDDSMSGVDEVVPSDDGEDAASDAGERDLDDNVSIAEELGPVQSPTKQRTKSVMRDPEGQRVYVRGIRDDQDTSIKSTARQDYVFGPVPEEFEPVYRAFVRWDLESCMPSRHTSSQGLGGFAYSEAFASEVKKAEENWKWYRGDGIESFRQRQVLRRLDMGDARKYLPIDGTGERSFVAGPLSAQKFFRTQVHQFITLSDPFDASAGTNGTATSTSAHFKCGFMINLGARVNCLDWAPNQGGIKQYLAVSLLVRNKKGSFSDTPNAFTAQPASNTSIQIWEFNATPESYIDKAKLPHLVMVLCARVGSVKDLKWCPVPTDQSNKLGLLGCVTGDGALRVFDIEAPTSDTATVNILIEKPAFESKPPNTVCTALTWLSSSRIAASCANGFVAIWDLSKCSSAIPPRPEQYLGISTSYISSIVSGYPRFPNMIMTNSITGHLSLTDLNRPKPASPMGTALSPRSRLSQLLIAWHDFSHMAISCEDNLIVRAHPIRRWFGTLGTNRLKSHATSIAVSPCHPFVLIGTAGGEAVCHNPMGRMVHGLRSELLLQPWFLHEWRRPTDEESKAAASATPVQITESSERHAFDGVIGTDGLSRIVDDFRAYATTLAVRDGTAPNVRAGVLFNTVYEEKSAVTSVAWNPNLHVGGWAAAGMADGLLRVEDIAVQR